MEKIENYILKNYLSNLKIPDKREENVLISYIRAFNFLVYENDITNILEIGAGNSSILFSFEQMAGVNSISLHYFTIFPRSERQTCMARGTLTSYQSLQTCCIAAAFSR